MTPQLKEKITQHINLLIYFDALENEYNDKNCHAMVEKVCPRKNHFDDKAFVSTRENLSQNGILGVAWETGGASGGNCWGGSAEAFTHKDPQVRELYLLDTVFENLLPDIKHTQYNQVMKNVPIHQESHGNYEYYGNRTDFEVKFIKTDELVKALEVADLKFNEGMIDEMNKGLEKKKNSHPSKLKKY